MENDNNNMEPEIDVLAILKDLWGHRRFIIRCVVAFFIVGIVTAYLLPKEYIASCTLVPPGKLSNQTSMLAAMAGINVGGGNTGGDVISPTLYPQIVNSIPYKKELMWKKISVAKSDTLITILDYFTNEKYKPSSIGQTVKKYTIGLPYVIKGWFTSSPISLVNNNKEKFEGVESLSAKELGCAGTLEKLIQVNVNAKEGTVVIYTTMEEAKVAAQIAAMAQEMLRHEVTKYKLRNVQANLDFISQRCDIAKHEYDSVQVAMAKFVDANQGISTARATVRMTALENELNLKYGVYSTLATQRENARIRVKEETPIYTVINPVIMPILPFKPQKMMIVAVFVFMGLFLGVLIAFGLPYLAKWTQSEKLIKLQSKI